MRIIDRVFQNEEEKIRFVSECEEKFYDTLESVINAIAARDNIYVITLSGPTCSGKTTTAHLLIEDLEKYGKNAVIVSIDDFFRDHEDGRNVGDEDIDYDSIDAIDFPYFAECVQKIFRKEPALLPTYDFETQKRSSYREYVRTDRDVVIFEGIQAVYPPIVDLLDDYGYTGIFTCVKEDVQVNGVHFTNHEIRLARRIVRDYKFRSAEPDFTLFLWEKVRENEEKNIFPNSNTSECKIDSFLAYELFLLKPYILSILSHVKEGNAYYEKAQALMRKFEPLPEISYEYVPESSMYTEFLGKK